MATDALPRNIERELGHPGGWGGGGGRTGNMYGPYGGDDPYEENPELQWPESVRVYDKMRRSDAQVAAIIRQLRYPIVRTPWRLDPNGAPENVVRRFAEDLQLPIMGVDPGDQPAARVRRKGRFSFLRHVNQAFLSTVFGHMPFVIVTFPLDDTDGVARLKKLSVRMPQTIHKWNVAQDGGLISIEQHPYIDPTPGGASISTDPIPIPVQRLVVYVNEMEGSNWYGMSILRSAYKHWMLKDRLYRVSAMTIERNGMGVPTVEGTVSGATPENEQKAQALATAYRAGEGAGGYIPYGFRLRLVGVEGSLPDALPYIKHHDEAIARNVLAMFMQLGSTETGSRALGGTFLESFTLSLQAIADEIADTFNTHVIEDFVDWNDGAGVRAPRVVPSEIGAESEIAFDALQGLVDVGAITPDSELERYLRSRGRIPQRAIEDTPMGPGYAYDLEYKIITINERRAAIGLPPIPGGDVPPTPPGTPAQLMAMNRRRVELGMAELPATVVDPAFGSADERHAHEHALATNDQPTFWRQLTAIELAATTDFIAMAARRDTSVDGLVAQWLDIRAGQLDELIPQIVEAVDANDIAALGSLTVTTGLGAQAIGAVLTDVLDESVTAAIAEAGRQGTTIGVPDLDDARALLAGRAAATDQLLASALTEVSGRRAVQLAGQGSSGQAVAAAVREHVEGLSDAYLRDQLGGAITGAENAGRIAVMSSAEPTRTVASELLDAATCGPCFDIDGTEYMNLADAEQDYPTGGFRDCDGGPRCRGTLVSIYGEAPAEA